MWRFRADILGALNIGFFFALLFISAYRLPGGVGCGRRDSTFSSRFFSVFSARGKFDVAENIGGDSGHRWRVFNRAEAFGASRYNRTRRSFCRNLNDGDRHGFAQALGETARPAARFYFMAACFRRFDAGSRRSYRRRNSRRR